LQKVWPEVFDVAGEVFAVLEVEFILAALLGRARRDVAVLGRVAEDVGAKLLVHQYAGFVLGHAAGQGVIQALVDHLFHGGDLRSLLAAERSRPAKHVFLERPTVVEGKDVERPIVSGFHNGNLLSLRSRCRVNLTEIIYF
jgi:hypothetical protein